MSPPDDAAAWRGLVDAASAPYRRSSYSNWHAARGKLRWDPVFRHLIAEGLVVPHDRVIDIGCGRGLLAHVIAAAAAAAALGHWPSAWAAAPIGVHVTGIDLHQRDIDQARSTLGHGADFICADMRSAVLPTADVIVILDVLHYVSIADQDRLLARIRGALEPGGRLVLRVGDSGARAGFASSFWVDRVVSLLTRRAPPQRGRSLAEWQARLAELGFETTSRPMRAGTPFANVLLVATRCQTPAGSGSVDQA